MHKKCRVNVEKMFGILKRRFLCLHTENRMAINRVPNVIISCCVLHNIAVKRGLIVDDDFENFDLHDFGMGDGEMPIERNNQNLSTRNHIVEQVFRPMFD